MLRARKILSTTLLVVNLAAVALMLLSAYGGYIHPRNSSWVVSLTMLFPLLLLTNFLFFIGWLLALSRKWLWSAAAMLLCICQIRTYCPINLSQPIPKGSIKVVSYNTYGFAFADKDTTQYKLMLSYLAKSDADILCAQESHYNMSHEHEMNAATNHWKYKDSVNTGKSGNALTIFSNFPILSRHIIHSSSSGHMCVVYNVKINSDTVLVANCHFVSNAINTEDKAVYEKIVSISDRDSTGGDVLRLGRKVNAAGQRRAEQADSLYEYLRQHSGQPIIVCGDFNEPPLSYVHTRLCDLLNDAYTRSGNGSGISYHLHKMYFRLDNILCSSHWKPFRAKVDNRHKMSDHYPVSVWLKRINT